jgi:hypothetical protein
LAANKLKDEDENMKVMKQNILHAVDMLIAHASAKEDAANKELKGNMSSILEDTMQLLGDRDAAFRSQRMELEGEAKKCVSEHDECAGGGHLPGGPLQAEPWYERRGDGDGDG